MTDFNGFTQEDFDIFTIPGLDARMEKLRGNISPKLEAIAVELAPAVTTMTGDEMYVHVAKHARRSKNPPNDTWAALARNNRGYKKLPHFQIGLWETHLFIWFAMIYENPVKQDYAEVLKKHMDDIKKQIPGNFVWSGDHTKPDATSHNEVDLDKLVDRLANVKKAEILCGVNIDRNDPILTKPNEFLQMCEDTFQKLEPLYQYTKEL
ncbi:Uncharacterized protein YktB, UPF0637 family [Salinibacillus kushneri]|uniref:UPF0637 protein SAMN05421676_109143 n=1 Tax=Salinibacillus kushneri TaxID=237682 RepID=A0A1I0HRH3_9BACI|nr:DUF1054 domain-containing protein [Salinibacillus kushneri]SET86600.1 Uncharacterized protein YktB, UPF0637 family [Salinibacillus kushneri]